MCVSILIFSIDSGMRCMNQTSHSPGFLLPAVDDCGLIRWRFRWEQQELFLTAVKSRQRRWKQKKAWCLFPFCNHPYPLSSSDGVIRLEWKHSPSLSRRLDALRHDPQTPHSAAWILYTALHHVKKVLLHFYIKKHHFIPHCQREVWRLSLERKAVRAHLTQNLTDRDKLANSGFQTQTHKSKDWDSR